MSYEIINESDFCVRYKNRRKHNQSFKLLFFTINLHFVTSNQIPTLRKRNLPLSSSIYLVFLPLEIQGWLKQTKVYHTYFYFVWKETTHKPLKMAVAKTLFSSVYAIGTLVSMNVFILCDNWKTLISIIVYFYSDILFTAMLLLSLKPLFWRKSVFYALPPQ